MRCLFRITLGLMVVGCMLGVEAQPAAAAFTWQGTWNIYGEDVPVTGNATSVSMSYPGMVENWGGRPGSDHDARHSQLLGAGLRCHHERLRRNVGRNV
jgi:hypothetical protein